MNISNRTRTIWLLMTVFLVSLVLAMGTVQEARAEACSKTVDGVVYPCDPLDLEGKDASTLASDFASEVIVGVLGLLGAGTFLMFMYGGTRILFAAGDPKRVSAGKKIIVYATIGLTVIFFSYAILNFALTVFRSAE